MVPPSCLRIYALQGHNSPSIITFYPSEVTTDAVDGGLPKKIDSKSNTAADNVTPTFKRETAHKNAKILPNLESISRNTNPFEETWNETEVDEVGPLRYVTCIALYVNK